MRPRSFDRGNVSRLGGSLLSRVASMRPRSFDRGNDGEIMLYGPIVPGFNEAAIFRSRKRGSAWRSWRVTASLQ